MALSAGILLILAVVLVGLPWSGLRIIVSNANVPDHKIRVAVSIDGKLVATSDVYPMEWEELGDWTVRAGSHLIEINFDYSDSYSMAGLEDPPEWVDEVSVGLFDVKDVHVVLH